MVRPETEIPSDLNPEVSSSPCGGSSPVGSASRETPGAVCCGTGSPTPPMQGRGRGFWGKVQRWLRSDGCSSCGLAGKDVRRTPFCRADSLSSVKPSEDERHRRRRRGRGWRNGERSLAIEGSQPLDLLPPGTVGRIREVNGVGPLRMRLLEMGVLPGTELRVERVAPLGDPIEVRVRGYALSLRRMEAAHILVDLNA